MLEIIDLCNNRKTASRRVNDGCEKIFFCLILKKNPIFEKAIIMTMNLSSFSIIIPKMHIETV